jgi:LPXTG-site transpeptidase (sortase) family protein
VTGAGPRWARTLACQWAHRVALAAAALLAAGVLIGGPEPEGTSRWPAWPGAPAGPVTAAPPTRVRIPAIRVDSPLESLGLDDAGALRAPVDYGRAGWYAGGTAPGDTGPAVIAGHVDSHAGPAVFFRLYQLRPGDLVQVQRGDRWLAFRVIATARYAKDRFPTGEVYGPTPDPQLRLITCGGSFDATRRSYVDNVVAYAVAE